MKPSLCISFRFLHPYPLFHGRANSATAEWPPSPMRAIQALLNAACIRSRGQPLSSELRNAFDVLEPLRPTIFAPIANVTEVGHRAYVPHNQTDLVASAWYRGNITASIASHRVEKDVRPHRIEVTGDELPGVHFVYPLKGTNTDPEKLLNIVRPVARSIYSLGWGIDQVACDATLLAGNTDVPSGVCWTPTPHGGRRLRVHRAGSCAALTVRHRKFLNRLVDAEWSPVPPLSVVEQIGYRRSSDPLPSPLNVFKLLDANGDTFSYPQSKFIHISGMVRHLAIEWMKQNPPRNLQGRALTIADWIGSYVAGHQSPDNKAANKPHVQFSFIPLPSIGHEHTDPAVRRVMIVAPFGDDALLEHLCQQLDGEELQPLANTKLPPRIYLERIRENTKDGVKDSYLREANVWASFTPVILPGHDDHKPEKTRKLIEKALQQSGIEQPCEFEWSSFSNFRKALSAHKYDREKRPTGYIRPGHLLNQTAVHLKIRFADDLRVPGPLLIGAGRHCGFGLMAPAD